MTLRARRGERGLTLVEMVLTLTILAVAGSLIFGALSTALRAWQGGFAKGREEVVARIGIERLAGQLRSIDICGRIDPPGKPPLWPLRVGEHEIRFVTLLGSGLPPAQVSYHVVDGAGGPVLLYREYPWPDKDFFGEGTPRREERIPEITGLTVTVRKRADPNAPAGAPSEGAWKPEDDETPESVTVELASGTGEDAIRYALTVPITSLGQDCPQR